MRQLRDYQREAVAHLREKFSAGARRVPMVLATGLGKTEIFTDPSLLDSYLDAGRRVLIIAHTDELIEQAAKKARRNNPRRRVGIVQGQDHNDVRADIIVATRQTLAGRHRREQIRDVGLIVVDEAHHATRGNTYGQILEHFGAFAPLCNECREANEQVSADAGKAVVGNYCPNDGCATMAPHVAGFTATLARGDREKLSAVWGEEAPFTRDILFGIRRGYLLDVRGTRVVVPELDMRNVSQRAGDYSDSGIAQELERTFAPEIIAKAYAEAAGARKGIAFWPLVDTAEHGARAFNDLGIRSEVIHGRIKDLPKIERRAMLRRLHTGETQVLHGVAVLTEGFDEPTADVVVIARPTRSAPLYQQMVGRVLRPNLELPPEQREKALILDVVGAGAAHDLRSLVDLAPDRGLKREHQEELSLLGLDDEYVLELGNEEQKAGAGRTFEGAEDYRGEVAIQEFDPLGRSQLWSRTPGGTWFMSAGGDAYAFLVPSLAGEPSHYDVVLCSKHGALAGGWARGTEHVDLPLELALGWAEEVAIEHGGRGTKTLTGRTSAWRRKPPSQKALSMARRVGVLVTPEMDTAGAVSDAIDAEYARRRIDPLVRQVLGA